MPWFRLMEVKRFAVFKREERLIKTTRYKRVGYLKTEFELILRSTATFCGTIDAVTNLLNFATILQGPFEVCNIMHTSTHYYLSRFREGRSRYSRFLPCFCFIFSDGCMFLPRIELYHTALQLSICTLWYLITDQEEIFDARSLLVSSAY